MSSKQPTIGIPERRKANKAELAEFFGVSLPTVERWVRKGCPAVQRGARGYAWVFDLLEVAQWKFGGEQQQEAEEIEPEKLPPKERKDWYDSETRRRQLQVQDRELIPAAEVEEAIAYIIRQVTMTLETLPDLLEREAGIAPAVVERAQRVIDAVRQMLAEKLRDAPG